MRSSNARLFIILVLGFVLRLVSLNQSLWLDETTSVKAARLSLFDLITKFSAGDFHPPLYYLVLKIWGSIFGWSEFSIRGLSILFALGTIYLVYKIGQKLFNEKTAFWASVFLSISPLFIYYSQEARMYSMETFLSTFVFYFFLNVTKDVPSRNGWIGLTASSILLFYTDYLPIFLLTSLGLYLFIFHLDHFKKYKKEWLKYIFIVAIVCMIWSPIFLLQLKTANQAKINAPLWIEILGKTNLKELALIPLKFVIGRISADNKIMYGILALCALLPFLVATMRAKNKLILSWLLGPIIFAAVFGFIFSGFSYFRLLFVLPAFYLLTAEGLIKIIDAQIQKLALLGVIFISTVCTLTYLFIPKFHREDWKGAVSWIEENSAGQKVGAVFVTESQKDPYLYYAKTTNAYGPQRINDNSYDKVYLMRYVQPIFDPQDTLRKKIELLGYNKIQEKDFNGVVVWEYQR